MRKYEIMYIVRPNIEDEAKKELVQHFTNILTERDATVDNFQEMGLKNLAYEINDFRKGYYFLLKVTAENEAITEFDRLAGISEDIIRFIVIKDEE